MSAPLLVPIQLDAFVLNPAICGKAGDKGTRICPITQPNYTFLRFENFVAESDVQPQADLHNAAPASHNPRLTDLGTWPREHRRNRHGVYLHWTLPRAYRAGLEKETDGSVTPEYIDPPTRWLVIRKLDLDTIQPATAKESFEEYSAWVIEGDYLWNLENIPAHYDLQVDVSPFLAGEDGKEVDVGAQAEMFIGRKTPLKEWKNDSPANPPRITLLGSGNQLFADFQQHNSNVFSMVDNFAYGNPKKPDYLNAAKASYYVIGWHRKEDVDPLWKGATDRSNAEKLESLFMSLQGKDKDWLAATDKARLLCHGAMYDVEWDWKKKPNKVPADDFARRLQDQNKTSVAVGTTALDALITYCKDRERTGTNTDDVAKLEHSILALQTLLHATDDGVEGQLEASDIVYNWNFMRSPGGIRYFLAAEEDAQERPLETDEQSKALLIKLNQHQMLLDSCRRVIDQHQWDIFALWWKYITDPSNDKNQEKQKSFKASLKIVKNKLNDAISQIDPTTYQIERLKNAIDNLKDSNDQPIESKKVRSGTHQPYYQARDPTVLVGGIDQGWPSDYLLPVKVRLPSQTVNQSGGPLPTALGEIMNQMRQKLAPAMTEEMLSAAEALIGEFYTLKPIDGELSSGNPQPGRYPPQFHDKLDKRIRDQWGQTQPWRPLYVEWEVEYVHIPFEYWSLDSWKGRLSRNAQIRYGIKTPSGDPLWDQLKKPSDGGNVPTLDRRTMSGRSLILPQPTFSLEARIRQLFSTMPPQELEKLVTKEQRDELLEKVPHLPYLSASLSGLTAGLLTMAQGTHIKPLEGTIEGKMTAIPSAQRMEAGFDKRTLEMIQGHSVLTPLAASVAWPDKSHCPFKPVTHGQFRFQKLNIIDKFGQALVGIDPQPRKTGPPPLYPCISDFYEPQKVNEKDINDKNANTVIEDTYGKCQFVQIPPQINQNIRLNACFVTRATPDSKEHDKKDPYWRPITEWENPIWGWVVTNYADYGLQFFLPDGTFYREVRVGGHSGTIKTPKWIPFEPSKDVSSTYDMNRKQFDALIQKLCEVQYIKDFWYMVIEAIDYLSPTPNSYAQYLTAIVGKPLALVNIGWSLELDRPPLENQTTNSHPAVKDSKPSLTDYQLQVKFGDKEREYDGLVGYFNTARAENPTRGEELDLTSIQTYFTEGDKHPTLTPITSETHPRLHPFWEPPLKNDASSSPALDKAADYDNRRNSHLQVYGALIDPFTPIHAYSSFLPPQSLQLAPWTWQDAMDRVTAFFHAGPITIIDDVKGYDQGRPLKQENINEDPPHQLKLPALGGGEWSWLQPYVNPNGQMPISTDESVSAGSGENTTDLREFGPPVYNSYGISKTETLLMKPGFERGPYTAIEGFLHLRRPMMVEKSKTEQRQEGQQGDLK
ncbi:hypothetical protein AFGD_003035 [Aspergillus flavus]|nr:hypothetical protein AFGD_003035 [Aspergillus flavus]